MFSFSGSMLGEGSYRLKSLDLSFSENAAVQSIPFSSDAENGYAFYVEDAQFVARMGDFSRNEGLNAFTVDEGQFASG